MRAEDRQQLTRALGAASAAVSFAALPSVDEDKDLVELGRAMRERRLSGFALPLAREAIRLRQQVVERNLPLAWGLAQAVCRRYAWVRLDDARQVAAEAITRAVARYRPGKAASDSGWLSTWVFRALERWARGETHAVSAAQGEVEDIDFTGPEVDIELAIDVRRATERERVRRAVRRLERRHILGGQWTLGLLSDRQRVARAIEIGRRTRGIPQGGQNQSQKDSYPATRASRKGRQSGRNNE
jgi:hypothetical protein